MSAHREARDVRNHLTEEQRDIVRTMLHRYGEFRLALSQRAVDQLIIDAGNDFEECLMALGFPTNKFDPQVAIEMKAAVARLGAEGK